MRSGYYVGGNEFAEFGRACRTCFYCSLNRAYVASYHNGYKSATDLLGAYKRYLSRFYHRVCRLNRCG